VFAPRAGSLNRKALIVRARKYVNAVPGAIEGQQGDISTFKLACRLIRGFALTDEEAMSLLSSWNFRCLPPWSERELRTKIASARRSGREAIGARLEYSR
jgi:hypothetical protein